MRHDFHDGKLAFGSEDEAAQGAKQVSKGPSNDIRNGPTLPDDIPIHGDDKTTKPIAKQKADDGPKE